MEKPEQVLIIEPQNELRFRGPFTDSPVTSYIKLINPTTHKVYFKIKTTAPRKYCVRPNSGLLKPKEVTEIAVVLQPHNFDTTEKNKHKFMVQTLIAPDNNDEEYAIEVWKDKGPDQLMESKLKCVFENPLTTTSAVKTTATVTTAKSDSNTPDVKNKATGDTVKSAPKVIGEAEEKLLKDINQMMVAESNLRQENLQLKEEVLKLRNAVSGNDSSLAATRGLTSHSSSQLQMSSTNIFIAIAMVVVGYLLGKLI